MKTNRVCPITKLPIAKRHAVHKSVLDKAIAEGKVIRNKNTGTLRQWVYRGC